MDGDALYLASQLGVRLKDVTGTVGGGKVTRYAVEAVARRQEANLTAWQAEAFPEPESHLAAPLTALPPQGRPLQCSTRQP